MYFQQCNVLGLMCIVCSTIHDAVNVTAEDILAPLRAKVSAANHVTKVNISRSHIWEGARRSFRRPTYSAEYAMSVKFTDDIGVSEGQLTKEAHEGNSCSWSSTAWLRRVLCSLAQSQPSTSTRVPLHTGTLVLTAHCPHSNNRT